MITRDSETVKHLFQMFSPNFADFKKAKREIEPYDDLCELEKMNLGQRINELRTQIYKNKVTSSKAPPSTNLKAPASVRVHNIVKKDSGFGVEVEERHNQQESRLSADISDVYPETQEVSMKESSPNTALWRN